MAYNATLNGEVFFSTDSISQALALSSASLELSAGAAGLFSFTVLPSNKFYDNFFLLDDYIDVYRNEDLIFSGRVSSISQAFDLSMNIEAQGLLTILNDSIFRPITHEGTLYQLLNLLIASHNEQVENAKKITLGYVQIADRACYRAYENYESTFSRLEDLVESFGGYLYIRKENGHLFLDWRNITTFGGQEVNFGENLLDISKGSESDEYISVLIPLGAQIENEETGERYRVTIESVNDGKDYIEAEGAISKIVGTNIWDDITEPANLLRTARTWLDAQSLLHTRIDVTAIDLADAGYDISNFEVGTVIRVTSEPHGLDGETFECLTQSLDLLSPDNNKLSLGGTVDGFTIKAKKQARLNVKAIERVEANYTTNKRLNDIKTLLDQQIQENYTLIEQNSEHIVLLSQEIKTASKIFYEEPVPPYSKGDLWYRGNVEEDSHSAIPGYAVPGYSIPGVGGDLYICIVDKAEGQAFSINDWHPTFAGQLGALNTRITTAKIDIDATKGQIDLLALDVNNLTGRISSAEINISSARTAITLNATLIDQLNTRITSAELEIDGANASITAVARDVDNLTGRVSTAEVEINGAKSSINAHTSSINSLTGRMSTAEVNISAANRQIELKVSDSDVTGNYLIGRINLSTTTATISASRINLKGAVTISSFDSTTQSKVITGTKSVNQYYLSSSQSELKDGSWKTSVTWTAGKYIWTRIATTKTYADSHTETSNSDAIYDKNLTTALSTSSSAQSTANAALDSTVSVYYRSKTSTAPAKPTQSTTIGTNDDTDDEWEYILPKPSYGKYFFTCERYTSKSSSVSYSSVRKMSNLTASSLWCSSNDATYINGQHIATGTIRAKQIDANAITADKIDAGAVTADKINVGDLSAISAVIGGWSIGEYVLSGTDKNGNTLKLICPNKYAQIGTGNTIEIVNKSNVTTFSLTSGGYLTVTDATITGLIKPTELSCSGTVYINTSESNSNKIILNGSSGTSVSVYTTGINMDGSTTHAQFDLNGLLYKSGSVIRANLKQTGLSFYDSSSNNTINISASNKTLYLYPGSGDATITLVGTSGKITCVKLTETSDRRAKRNIASLNRQNSADFIYGLDPISYERLDYDGQTYHGFTTDDVKAAISRYYQGSKWGIVTVPDSEDKDGVQYESLAYSELIADLVATVQSLNERVMELEQRR